MQVTEDYVKTRFAQFVDKYRTALRLLGYSEELCLAYPKQLEDRLATRGFRTYGARPINILHGGKRLTRFYIKTAIENSPAQKAIVQQLRDEYENKVRAARARNPHESFFSFEAAYASKIRVKLSKHKSLFMLNSFPRGNS